MFHFHDRLSPRQRFWLGFLCCPLITWASFAGIALLSFYRYKIPPDTPLLITGFFLLVGFVFLCGIPLFSGLSAGFFWHKLPPKSASEGPLAFWSVVFAWLPTVVWIATDWTLLYLPFLIFVVLYAIGLWHGRDFWNSNRPRQWLGDFSDSGSIESEAQ